MKKLLESWAFDVPRILVQTRVSEDPVEQRIFTMIVSNEIILDKPSPSINRNISWRYFFGKYLLRANQNLPKMIHVSAYCSKSQFTFSDIDKVRDDTLTYLDAMNIFFFAYSSDLLKKEGTGVVVPFSGDNKSDRWYIFSLRHKGGVLEIYLARAEETVVFGANMVVCA